MSSDWYGNSGYDRVLGIQDVLNGKFSISQGLQDLCKALKCLGYGKEYETQKALVEGIHYIKKGLYLLENGLHELRGEISRSAIKEIEESICCIHSGLKVLCEVLKDVCCEQKCEAEKALVEGTRLIKEGLCGLEKALDDICLY